MIYWNKVANLQRSLLWHVISNNYNKSNRNVQRLESEQCQQ